MSSTSKPVYCSTLDKTFPSKNSVALHLKIHMASLNKVLNGMMKTSNGHSFEWYDEQKHPKPDPSL